MKIVGMKQLEKMIEGVKEEAGLLTIVLRGEDDLEDRLSLRQLIHSNRIKIAEGFTTNPELAKRWGDIYIPPQLLRKKTYHNKVLEFQNLPADEHNFYGTIEESVRRDLKAGQKLIVQCRTEREADYIYNQFVDDYIVVVVQLGKRVE